MWRGQIERGQPPNALLDPLAETTLGRRIWALYQIAGYSRSAFASVLGVAYSSVDNWVQDQTLPTVPMLARIALMFRVGCDDLIFGRGQREQKERDFEVPELLSTVQVCAWLRAHGASDADISDALRMVAQRPPTAAALRVWWVSRQLAANADASDDAASAAGRVPSPIGLAALERVRDELPDAARRRRRSERSRDT